jgi:ATP-dependent DNA helicase RecQ
MRPPDLQLRAQQLLEALYGPGASFRDGQWDAIRAVAESRRRVLVVQRTGWGKSFVYFLATRLTRDAGAGPTILISPLLSLMRNQEQMAERMGVRGVRIDSSNVDKGRVFLS